MVRKYFIFFSQGKCHLMSGRLPYTLQNIKAVIHMYSTEQLFWKAWGNIAGTLYCWGNSPWIISCFIKLSEQLLPRGAASEFTGNSHSFYHPVTLLRGNWREEGTINPENQLSFCRLLWSCNGICFWGRGNVARRSY